APEQHGRVPEVLTVACTVAGSCEPRGRTVGQVRIGLPELSVVPARLLEVVPDDLVALDEGGAVLVEPVCQARVQIGTDRLGQRVVGGIPDQQVTEAIAVVADELGAVGTNELVAYERG